MSSITVAFAEAQWDEILNTLNDPRETAAVLLAGEAEAETDSGLVLTINRVIWVPDSEYELRTNRELQIASRGWMPSLRIASDGGWLPIFLHTHPGGSADPSTRDEAVDTQLSATFRTRVGCSRYVSLIFGGTTDHPTFTGKVFEQASQPSAITRIRVAGRRLRIQNAEDNETASSSLDIYDRQVRAFGPEGQQLLHNLRVGVVGCGGTGSAVLEQLTRLGVGSLTLIDYDTVTDTNVTRIYGSTLADVDRPKIDVLSNHLASIGLKTSITPVNGNITSREVMERLRDCDLIFGCTDDDGGRGVLSRLAYWYLIPVIDMGVVITSSDGEVSGVFGRITTATPGEPCLLCRGEFDTIRAREEQYSEAERQALVSEGYAQGLAERDPAVVAYTTMVAAHAVADMMQRLFGFGDMAIPSKQLLRISDREIRRQKGAARDGCYCANPRNLGRADRESALGTTWAS
jgi:molybdopterin/thiamine biosynthesis adenylyltransferase